VPATGIFIQRGRKATLQRIWGEERVRYTLPAQLIPGLPETRLSFFCGGFSQVNYRQNLALIETVLTWAGLSGRERVLDLFCGNGNFSLAAAPFCHEVIGLEAFEQSIKDAVANARENGIPNAYFSCVDSGVGVRELISAGRHFDVVILDPPREGALDAVRLIPSLAPEKVLYVSCDPATLARDLAVLRNQGYTVVSSRAVDMFPQTYHIESVTMLVRTR
jgi:23S rRNA (uracil1939-C5)-methyltransferase